jgi:hypothetical protein
MHRGAALVDTGWGGSPISRRSALKRVAATGAFVWSAPVLLSMNSAATAGTLPPPSCVGGSCGNLTTCSPTNPDCVCFTRHGDGGICLPGNTDCAQLTACPDGTCPPGFACLDNTCCDGKPSVCVPLNLTGACPPASGSAPMPVRTPGGAGTIGG